MNLWLASAVAMAVSWAGESLPAPAAAITTEQAARLYRIEIYNTYRLDRSEHDRRLALGQQVWQRYRDAGEPNAARDEVVQWFVAAREASRARQPLPEAPQLGAAVARKAQPADNQEYPITSGREETTLTDPLPPGAATSLSIELPPTAVATEPASKTPAKQTTFSVRVLDPEVEGTTDPIIVDLPTGKRVDVSVETPELATPETASAPKKESATAPTATAVEVPAEDPFAVQNLFEPATTAAPATEAATDVDPFAP